jgi:TetR/AcrR family transcriptional repressor of lmrAB and yxaGH operons
MPRPARAPAEISPRTKLVLATLDLLRHGGLSGAGINQVVDASGAPKGSVYHYFPGGKQELVIEALGEAERVVGDSFGNIFGDERRAGEKVRALFAKAAAALEANSFAKGCPVAAVTLDLDQESAALRAMCHRVFDRWVDVIAHGLDDVPRGERRSIAQLIFATLEGALVLARAGGSKTPLLESGASLATVLEARFPRRRRARRT